MDWTDVLEPGSLPLVDIVLEKLEKVLYSQQQKLHTNYSISYETIS